MHLDGRKDIRPGAKAPFGKLSAEAITLYAIAT